MNPRLQLALDLAAEASFEIEAAYRHGQHRISEKSANDFATETDAKVEALFAARIAAIFPGDCMLGEEGGERALVPEHSASGWRWIVDPLDGTFNFVHGFPYFAVSIAVELAGEVRLGVIANPLTGEFFYAERGGGAWLQSAKSAPVRLTVSACDGLSRALVASVLPSSANASFESVLSRWLRVARAAASIRRTGAAALDLAQVAAGRLDGFFVMSLAAWDAAAGALLVTEAGGVVCDFDGSQNFLQSNRVIAGTPAVAHALSRVLMDDGAQKSG